MPHNADAVGIDVILRDTLASLDALIEIVDADIQEIARRMGIDWADAAARFAPHYESPRRRMDDGAVRLTVIARELRG